MVHLLLGWIHNIYNGIEQRRSILVRRSAAVSRFCDFFLWKKKTCLEISHF